MSNSIVDPRVYTVMEVSTTHIRKEAARLGCRYLNLDTDGMVYDGITEFDW